MYNSDILINPDQSGELTAFVRSAECQNGNTYCEKVYEAEWDSQGLGNWTWYDENDVIIESGNWED